jgi:hypothetical protein
VKKVKIFNLRHFFSVIIAGLILWSCSEDPTPEEKIVGNWTTESATFTAMVGNKTITQYLIDEVGLTEAQAQSFMVLFNSELQQSFTGTMQIKPDYTYTATLGGEADDGTWSLSSDEKKLTIDSSTEEPMILDVIELTSSRIHLRGTQTIAEDLNDDSTFETITLTVDLTFTKQ